MAKQVLNDVLNGRENNYLLPFLWQRGEEEDRIREEMSKVEEAGIRAVCVEARPHPDFLGPKWWQDMDAIMEEARSRGMKVWLLDDDHFPTGHAVGKVKDASKELHRLYLKESHVDVFGPKTHGSFLMNAFTQNPFRPGSRQETNILAVIAARRHEDRVQLVGEYIDVTHLVKDGVLYWDVPEGFWRIFVLLTSNDGGSEGQKDYINVLDANSVKILIDTVYEAHYERYRDDFGDTFAGFFSDEPGFYNDRETFDYNSNLGKKGVDLLWCSDLLEQISCSLGKDFTNYLPLLWHDDGINTAAVRYTYMNVVSKLYGKHFTEQIGDWCRTHQVEYIGHVLEDNGVHTRLGCGVGHYFRALWGQDMAGLDVVLWQLAPGFGNGPYAAVVGDADGEFFQFGLGKMGSSLAHIDPKKKGRAMCEVYGAFGWAEGLKLMKWMTDHLLVRGINYFVPHAFSQRDFPDWDCPPHFYARGKNPQYRYYAVLNHYINRVSHLLSGGRHVASAAVLYHGESDWSGMAMPFQQPVRALMQNQIDCDVLPVDVILNAARVQEGKLLVGDESYDCLVLPGAEALPEAFMLRLLDLAEVGLPLFFVDKVPQRASEGCVVPASWQSMVARGHAKVLSLEGLAPELRRSGFFDISTSIPQADLRHYHVEQDDLSIFMFFNENPHDSVETDVFLPLQGKEVAVYDALSNSTYKLPFQIIGESIQIKLKLSPYQTLFFLAGDALLMDKPVKTWQLPDDAQKTINVAGPWIVATAIAEAYPQFTPYKTMDTLFDLNQPEFLPRFSGTFRYTAGFNCDTPSSSAVLNLGEVYETAEVWVNGVNAGVRIVPPYQINLGGFLREGWNDLVVEVTNTLVKNQQDFLSRQTVLEPGGLIGPVTVAIAGDS